MGRRCYSELEPAPRSPLTIATPFCDWKRNLAASRGGLNVQPVNWNSTCTPPGSTKRTRNNCPLEGSNSNKAKEFWWAAEFTEWSGMESLSPLPPRKLQRNTAPRTCSKRPERSNSTLLQTLDTFI